jgi:peptide/nickel transport system permease protein
MQSSMADVLQEEYITTAHAKGLSASTVREKHAARNAILPVLSRLVISLPYLLTGIVIIESSLGWPGMGTTLWNSLYWQDMPLVMDMLLIVGLLSLVARLVLDVLIAYLDPRIRYGQRDPSLV